MNAPLQDSVQLAIETTGQTGSVAVLAGESVLRQTVLDGPARTAAALGPAIEKTLQWCQKNHHSLGLISVADGPGSFTGLRIAVTTAKTLSYALAVPLVSLDSLAAIAAASLVQHPSIDSLVVALNAYRGQVFYGSFNRSELLVPLSQLASAEFGDLPWTSHPTAVRVGDRDDWQTFLRSLPADAAIAGDEAAWRDRASERLDRPCDAVGVGLLGVRAALRGQWQDPISLVPRYLKPSAAEEQLSKPS